MLESSPRGSIPAFRIKGGETGRDKKVRREGGRKRGYEIAGVLRARYVISNGHQLEEMPVRGGGARRTTPKRGADYP